MDTTLEIENSKLKEQNNELVKTLQYWKMTAAQRENDKIALMKENNDLRLKLSRFSNTGNVLACNLDTALQSASEKALAHLVRASEEIARTMELAKAYKRDRQELNETSPRWNMLRGTPLSEKKDKVHRVPPLMMGGQSIQPVVALSRTGLDTITRRSPATTASQNTNVTMRSMPLRLLQEVYIPLTRVDADNQAQNMDVEGESNNTDDSMEDLGLDDSTEREMEDSQRMSQDPEMEASRLDTVREEIEPEEETPLRNRIDNPLEGPSWMLDVPPDNQGSTSKSNLEPDSTTEVEEINSKTPVSVKKRRISDRLLTPGVRLSCEFSPTVRRRKRSASSPPASPILPTHCSPRHNYRRNSPKGRVLKVVLSKMQPQPAPRARLPAARFDAPSPNGATLPGLVVSEDVEGRVSMEAGDGDGDLEQATMNLNIKTERTTGDTAVFRDEETRSRACSSESDSGAEGAGGAGGAGGRSRRHRKPVVYKEKPLNRKMRR